MGQIQGIGKVESQTQQSGVRSWVSKRTTTSRKKPDEEDSVSTTQYSTSLFFAFTCSL